LSYGVGGAGDMIWRVKKFTDSNLYLQFIAYFENHAKINVDNVKKRPTWCLFEDHDIVQELFILGQIILFTPILVTHM